MRPIKFRAINLENEWCYGYYFVEEDPEEENEEDQIRAYIINGTTVWNVYRETVCEFTGLYDSSDKEIYENDILKIGKFLLRVVFHEAQFSLKEIPKGEIYFTLNEVYKYSIIVGSTHENPELLESKSCQS